MASILRRRLIGGKILGSMIANTPLMRLEPPEQGWRVTRTVGFGRNEILEKGSQAAITLTEEEKEFILVHRQQQQQQK
jgi:hypothetical protein